MKPRLINLEAAREAIKPYLQQYLEEHGLDTQLNFSCINPKHTDSSPSMTCRKIPNEAFCFGCGMSVDIFKAANLLEGKPNKGSEFIEENLMYLAKKYNVQLKLVDLTPEEIYEYRTYQAYKMAAELISNVEFGDYKLVDEEIERRVWDKDKCASWGMGTVNTEEFKAHMRAAGFEPKFLDGVDLDRSNLFNNRNLIFTVFDDEGRPVGFSAKNLKYQKNGNNGPKYTNTRGTGLECAIFKKGERLYGYDVAKDAPDPLYIFEGQADVVTARHHGLLNCCSAMGTAITDHHITLLKKHGSFNIVLVFDADEGGQEAAQKVIDNKFSKEKDFRIKLCQLPDGTDPDELIRKSGFDAFVRLKKWTAFEWRIALFMEQIDGEVTEDQKRDIAEKMVPIIVSEKSHIRQEEMAKQVSRMTGYDMATVLSEVKRLRSEKDAGIRTRKTNLIEALLSNVRHNPADAEVALAQCQTALNDINKSLQIESEESSTLSTIMSLKEADENKTGEFAGFYMKPDGLGSIAARLNEDWKQDCLLYVGGGEQASKCVKYDALVLLPSGRYKTIEDIVKDKDSHVLGMAQNKQIIPRKVSRWIDSGKLECFKVITKQGISTEVSEIHPYYTLDGWKQVKELKVGDKIAIARNYDCFNNLHSPISEEKAILLGAFLSEGSITEGPTICNTDKEFISTFKHALDNTWKNLELVWRDYVSIYIKDNHVKHNRVKDWLKELDLLGKTAHTKLIPDAIFECSPKRIGKFLGMFWAGDGWVSFNSDKANKCEVGLALCNYKMLKQIRSLLLRFGIKTKITYEVITNQSGKKFDAYKISIRDIENIKKFYNNIKIPLKRKQDNLKAILDSDKNNISSYGDNFPVELWERIKEKAYNKGWTFNYLMTLIGEDKNRSNYDKSKDRFKETAAWYPTANDRNKSGIKWLQITPRKLRLIGNLLNDKFLIDLADGDIFFDEITAINPIGKHQCYDLEIPNDHNFIAEDTVVHNTTLCCQMAYEIADDPLNNALCIYHSIDDAAKRIIYKWVCNASNGIDLDLNHVSNPNYWAKQEGFDYVPNMREAAYRKVLKMIKDGQLVVKDASDGSGLVYSESIINYYRERYPTKNIVFYLDNFHKLPDHAEINGHERVKRLSNHLKNMAVTYHISIVATAEYKKLEPGQKPTNLALAESRSLSYDADVILHLYNDLHHKGEHEAVLMHRTDQGNTFPRIWCKFGKNKITGWEGREFLDLYPYNAQLKPVDIDQAEQDQRDRLEFIKENLQSKMF